MNWSPAAPGPHTVVARALDGRLALTSSATVSVSVTNQPPTVALTSPEAGSAYTYPTSIPLAARPRTWTAGSRASSSWPMDRKSEKTRAVRLGRSLGPVQAAARFAHRPGRRCPRCRDTIGRVVVSVARTTILAYSVPAEMVGTQSYTSGLGMDFDVLSPVVVTKLGVFDSGGNGLSSTLTVQLFRRSPPVSVLAALTFTPAAPGTLEPGLRVA